ncbi:MAG: hypothetical protein ACLT3Y_05570 [Ruminococcus callidus]
MRQHKESAQSLSYHIALGGIIAALCIACMFLTGVFPMFYLILPMLASAFIYIMVLETSGYWGFLTYLSVGLLSIFVTPNKDASLAFLFFFGYFPCCAISWSAFAGSSWDSCSAWRYSTPLCWRSSGYPSTYWA